MTAAPRKGRPPVADKRQKRTVQANATEWARILADAKAAGMGVSAYIRERCGL